MRARLGFHHHTPEQAAVCLAFHQQATNQVGGDQLGGAGEKALGKGWGVLDCDQHWAYRFHRDEKSWSRDPMVFVDMGRAMPDGSPALLKSRRHLHKDQAEEFWK